MDRRRFLALCGAGAGLLAGCSTDLGGRGPTTPGTPTGSADRDPTTDPDEPSTDTPTPPPPLDGSWESYRHDVGNTGGSDDPGPAERPTGVWTRVTATGHPVVSPAALDSAFVVATHTGVLYVREASDGAVRWSRGWPAETTVDPVGTGGTVVAAAGDEVAGLRADTGRDRWRTSYDAPVEGLAVTGDGVVVATGNGLATVAPREGTERWRHPTDGTVVTAPAVGPGTVAVGLSSGEVLAVEPGADERRWRASVGATPEFAPAVGDGLVYAGAGSDLVALDAGDGSRAWSVGTDHPVAAPPVTTADGVCFCTLNPDAEPDRTGGSPSGDGTPTPTGEDARWFEARAVALSPEDGTERWRAERTEGYSFTSGPPESLPLAAVEGRVLLGTGGRLHAYDAATGERGWSVDADPVVPAVSDGVLSTGSVGVDPADGSVVWHFRTGDGVNAAPAIVGNTVYAGSDDDHLYALAANTGEVDWAVPTDDMVRASPAVGDDAVYVGTMNGSLYAFDRTDGTERWRTSVGGQVQSPALADGTVYVGNFSNTLFALDAADGTERWRTEVDGEYFVALETAVGDGAVYAGANGDLRAFDVGDGSERWRAEYGEREVVQSSPAVADGRVFVNAGDSLRALDAADGSERWSRATGGAHEPPAVYDGTVYAPGNDAVHAFDTDDGTERWRTDVGGDLRLAVGDAVYGQRYDTPLLALDRTDGTVLWRHGGFEGTTSPALADEYLFVGDGSGRIRAVGPEP